MPATRSTQATQKWITIALGVAVVVLAAMLVWKGFSPPKATAHADVDGGDAAAASVVTGGAILALGDAGDLLDGSLLLSDLASPLEGRERIDAGVWSRLGDGTPVPPLPANAPKTVRFGVVLVSYQGAQTGPVGEKPNPRAKPDAKVIADKLAGEAAADFRGAVQHGDPGSQEDVGRIRPGFLEPSTEYVLFTLPLGTVSPAFDTPRGYWIVKRIE